MTNGTPDDIADWIAAHEAERFQDWTAQIRGGNVRAEAVARLRHAIEETPQAVIVEGLRASDDPEAAFAAFNELLSELGLDRLPPESPTEARAERFIEATAGDQAALESFLAEIGTAGLSTFAAELSRGAVSSTREATLTEHIEALQRTVIEDALAAAFDDPFAAAGAFNDVLDALGLQRLPPPEPDAGPLPTDLEIEERPEAAVDAEDEIRRVAHNTVEQGNLSTARDILEALREMDPSLAPQTVATAIPDLDDEGRDRLIAQIQQMIEERDRDRGVAGAGGGTFIDEAEPEPRPTPGPGPKDEGEPTGPTPPAGDIEDEFPIVFEAAHRAPGRDASHFRQLKQVIKGQRPALEFAEGKSTIPTDEFRREIERLQDAPAAREALLEFVEASEAGVRMGEGGGGGGGVTGVPAGLGAGGRRRTAPNEQQVLQQIENEFPPTVYSITDRPNVLSPQGKEELRERFGVHKYSAFERFERDRIQQAEVVDPVTYMNVGPIREEMEQSLVHPAEFLAAQRQKFFEGQRLPDV